IAIDLEFAAAGQTPRAAKSLAMQLGYSYSRLRRCGRPPAFFLTSYTAEVAASLEEAGSARWAAGRSKEPFWRLFPPASVVYLSPDAPLPLERVDGGRIYVVGGIVDRSVRKGIEPAAAATAAAAASAAPAATAGCDVICWPNPVLNVDAVVAILAACHERGGEDWTAAFAEALPRRKGGQ
ncbi:unnamed protein product, partial [Phaeothamnion confervicola]